MCRFAILFYIANCAIALTATLSPKCLYVRPLVSARLLFGVLLKWPNDKVCSVWRANNCDLMGTIQWRVQHQTSKHSLAISAGRIS